MPLVLVEFLALPEEAAYAPVAVESVGLESSDEVEELSHQSLIGFSSQLGRFPFARGAGSTPSGPGGAASTTNSAMGLITNMTSPSTAHSRNSSGSSMADVVLKGALDAFYSTNDDDFFCQGRL